MINDLFKIVVDPVFAPRVVPDHARENNFELIYKENQDSTGPAVNKRRPFTFDLCYPIPSLKPFIGKTKILVRREILPPIPVVIKRDENIDENFEEKLERAHSSYHIEN